MAKIKLSDEKRLEIESFLKNRFRTLEDMRSGLDTDIQEEINIYNNIDKYIDKKKKWEEKVKVPYIYTIVQTMFARVYQSLFGSQNYIKIYSEEGNAKDYEKDLQHWVQCELDKIKFKFRARDYLEDSMIERTNWIILNPVRENNVFKYVDFDVYGWFDVWFDIKALTVEDTDFFVRKIIKLYKILDNSTYDNTAEIKEKNIEPPEIISKNQEYERTEAKHGSPYWYDPYKNNVTDEVELLEYYGDYDLSEDKTKTDIKPVIFVLANREILIRAETVDLKTKRKKLIFPIRPLQQAKSLIGKSVPQLIKDQQYELNEIRSLRLQNFKTLIKLLFKYNKNGGIDFSELYAGGGNCIGWEDDPNDIDIFQVPNMVQIASFMGAEMIQSMQQTTGAVDYLMGTSAARGATETASGIKTITEQALFKFNMMAENVYYDILSFINFMVILNIKYRSEDILDRYPKLKDFFDQRLETLEDSYIVDVALKDLSVRRDVERSQFINASNIILPVLQNVGGNAKAYLRQIMTQLNMENIDEIIDAPPEQQQFQNQLNMAMSANPMLSQILQALMQNPGLSVTVMEHLQMQAQQAQAEAQKKQGTGTPKAVKQSMPEEEAMNETPERI